MDDFKFALMDLPPEMLTQILSHLPLSSWSQFALVCKHFAHIVVNCVADCAARAGLCPQKTNFKILFAAQWWYHAPPKPRSEIYHAFLIRHVSKYRILNVVQYNNPPEGYDMLVALNVTEKDLSVYSCADGSYAGHIHVIRYWWEQSVYSHRMDDVISWSIGCIVTAASCGHLHIIKYLWPKVDIFKKASHGLFPFIEGRLLCAASNNDQFRVIRYLIHKGVATGLECVIAINDLFINLANRESTHVSQRKRLNVLVRLIKCAQAEGTAWQIKRDHEYSSKILKACVVQNDVSALKFFMNFFELDHNWGPFVVDNLLPCAKSEVRAILNDWLRERSIATQLDWLIENLYDTVSHKSMIDFD